jgi:hypothetical protein
MLGGLLWGKPVLAEAPPEPVRHADSDLLARLVAGVARDVLHIQAPLMAGDASVAMTLKRAPLFSADARFVFGGLSGVDTPAPIDPQAFTLFRGEIDGDASSRVIVVATSTRFVGYVEQAGKAWLLHEAGSGFELAAAGPVEGGLPPGVVLCGAEADAAPTALPRARDAASAHPGRRVVHAAVDTDYQYFTLFPDEQSAALYTTALYATVADIYARDLNLDLKITYVRLWNAPEDPFQAPHPLLDFATHWQTVMSEVPHDAAQLLSGRRDLPFSGTAFVSSICDVYPYSVVGFANGWTRDGGLSHWDIMLTAHELAHNLGALHTHSYGVDACAPDPGLEHRGTIMSYCTAHNGGVTNIDLRFDTVSIDFVAKRLASTACLVTDCNSNGRPDSVDAIFGSSHDVNRNRIPDECEDCNGDGILDGAEIAAGAPDVDGDGVPDGCAPDCNGNQWPDAAETFRGMTADIDFNGVPDACQNDCDGNGAPDVIEVYTHLDSDVNRNGILDVCEDCDGDGQLDRAELASAHMLWVANGMAGLRSYAPDNGARIGAAADSPEGGSDLIISPAGHVLVALPEANVVAAFDGQSGAKLPDFLGESALDACGPAGLLLTPHDTLLVSCRDANEVREFDLAGGALIRVVVASGAGGLISPYGLAIEPDGGLLVASAGTSEILAYELATGAFRGVFVSADFDQLEDPRGMTLRPNGNLLVAGLGSGVVVEYDGQTGQFLRVFNGPTSSEGNQIDPWGVRIAPNGAVLISANALNGGIIEYDQATGRYLRGLVDGRFSGLRFPTAFAFMPGDTTDCNFNQIPDECDFASGRLHDVDSNGAPDECANDCDSNGIRDEREILPAGWRYDCNLNGMLDDCELATGSATDFDGDHLIDACDSDRDNDGVANNADLCPTTPARLRVRSNGAPIGDGNNDCRVSWRDLTLFTACLDAHANCPAFDSDEDARTTLADFAGLQLAIGSGKGAHFPAHLEENFDHSQGPLLPRNPVGNAAGVLELRQVREVPFVVADQSVPIAELGPEPEGFFGFLDGNE